MKLFKRANRIRAARPGGAITKLVPVKALQAGFGNGKTKDTIHAGNSSPGYRNIGENILLKNRLPFLAERDRASQIFSRIFFETLQTPV